jgi:hypothetical protein
MSLVRIPCSLPMTNVLRLHDSRHSEILRASSLSLHAYLASWTLYTHTAMSTPSPWSTWSEDSKVEPLIEDGLTEMDNVTLKAIQAMSSPPSPLSEDSWEVEVQEALTEDGLTEMDNMDTMDEDSFEDRFEDRFKDSLTEESFDCIDEIILCIQEAKREYQNAQTKAETIVQDAKEEAQTLAFSSAGILHDAQTKADTIAFQSKVILHNAQREAEAVLIEAKREADIIRIRVTEYTNKWEAQHTAFMDALAEANKTAETAEAEKRDVGVHSVHPMDVGVKLDVCVVGVVGVRSVLHCGAWTEANKADKTAEAEKKAVQHPMHPIVKPDVCVRSLQ